MSGEEVGQSRRKGRKKERSVVERWAAEEIPEVKRSWGVEDVGGGATRGHQELTV